MTEVVGGYALSHTGLMVTRGDDADLDQTRRVFDAFATVGREIAELAPDALIIFATDHMQVFPLNNVATVSVGINNQAKGMGDAGVESCTVPINQAIARLLLAGAIERGIDLAFSEDARIDHSFVVPLELITPAFDVAIVPFTVNCNVAPRPTFGRCLEIGAAIREVLHESGTGRVVVIGSGGLSHWVGSAERQAFMNDSVGNRISELDSYPLSLPTSGPINSAFDRRFLDLVCAGALPDFASSMTPDELERQAGNGAHELRNWLIAASVLGHPDAEVVAYEAIEPWLTGIGVVRFVLGG